MTRYAITGGAGFIGSHIAEELLKTAENEVVVIDNLSTGRESNLDGFRDRIEFHKEDVRDAETMAALLKGVDFVFHEAALVSVNDSIERPRDNHAINFEGTLNVLEGARHGGVKRVVLASSCAVYGNDPGLPKVEAMPHSPESPYAMAKACKEYYAKVYSQLFGIPVIALRYFNVYGPRQDPSSAYSGVISIFVDRLLKGSPITIFGDGKQSRDFVYVGEVVKMNLLAMSDPGLKGGEVFNVGTGRATDLLELAALVDSLVGAGVTPTHAEARPGEVRESRADISRAEKILGFKPTISIKEGLSRLIESVKQENLSA